MTLLGQSSAVLNSVVCSKFKPTLLEGQLCYALNLTLIKTENSKAGQRDGLMFVIDQGITNGGRQKSGSFLPSKAEINNLDLEDSEGDSNVARIYLNTLSSFTDTRSGSYAMSSLKKMTGTDSFLAQTEEQKKCRIETLEDCQAKNYLDNVQKQCGCVPWALNSALPSQVKLYTNNWLSLNIQDVTFCPPSASGCYTAVLRNITGCTVSCTGLYADVQFTEDRILSPDTTMEALQDLAAVGKTIL